MLSKLSENLEPWDIVVIGGGATGLGIALDGASRGYRTLLLEQHDFAKGTSSRSTKLIHGGVRYLQQGDISLVFEALKERGRLRQNAPHLVRDLSFVIPVYDWWGGPFYSVGLKVYDMMAGRLGLGPSRRLSRSETIEALPTVKQDGLRGGVIYHDGQFDDARMAITIAKTASEYGAVLLNYFKVVGLHKQNGIIEGVQAIDEEHHKEYYIKAKVVINATGVYADSIIKMDDPGTPRKIIPSQGVHIVLDRSFSPSDHAILVPETSDGRVLFAVPWYNHLLVGTTDTIVEESSLEPVPLRQEVEFILHNAGKYLSGMPQLSDVKSVFSGLRPLAASSNGQQPTKEISRHHKVLVSVSGLVSVIGGKWTTYRQMAEDAVNQAIMIGNLAERQCITSELLLHGFKKDNDPGYRLAAYGTAAEMIMKLERQNPDYKAWLSEPLQITKGQVAYAVHEEMALHVEDVLARRTRALFLDAQTSILIAPEVARILAEIRGKDETWMMHEIESFVQLANRFLP